MNFEKVKPKYLFMLSSQDLERLGVFTFENYGDNFYESDILIGNGFSINLCARLNYQALYDQFKDRCSPELVNIFESFGTSNFELIIDALHRAKIISDIVGGNLNSLPKLISELQEGLIYAIQRTHPTYAETNMAILRSLATELSIFKNIYTTNYDILLYKIILCNNELNALSYLKSEEFQDAFYEEINETQLGLGQINIDKRQIYYLHGALFLYCPHGTTYKLRKIDSSLEFIRLIKREVDNNNFPLFVSEGNQEDKRNAINKNYYLRICAEALRNNRTSKLTTFGFSFSRPDKHIVDYINASKIKEILISIYPNYSTKDELDQELSRLRDLFGIINVNFYDSRTLFTFDHPLYQY